MRFSAVAVLVFSTVLVSPAFAQQALLPKTAPAPVTAPAPAPAVQPSGLEFHGFKCEGSCAKHQTGYDWAKKSSVTDITKCANESRPFVEGCLVYVLEDVMKVPPAVMKQAQSMPQNPIVAAQAAEAARQPAILPPATPVAPVTPTVPLAPEVPSLAPTAPDETVPAVNKYQ